MDCFIHQEIKNLRTANERRNIFPEIIHATRIVTSKNRRLLENKQLTWLRIDDYCWRNEGLFIPSKTVLFIIIRKQYEVKYRDKFSFRIDENRKQHAHSNKTYNS